MMKMKSIVCAMLMVFLFSSCVQTTNKDIASGNEISTVEGFELNENGVSLVVPECLGSGAEISIEPEQVMEEGNEEYSALPEYRHIKIANYAIEDSSWQPEINIYPVARFNELIPGNRVADDVARLQNTVTSQQLPADGIFPFLPYSEADKIFLAAAGMYDFQNGQGIHYLTQRSQEYIPINNQDIAFTFQGLTEDGKYWVSIIFPINVSILQSSANVQTVPENGIQMPLDESQYPAYYSAVRVNIHSIQAENFTPNSSCIIQLVMSLKVKDY